MLLCFIWQTKLERLFICGYLEDFPVFNFLEAGERSVKLKKDLSSYQTVLRKNNNKCRLPNGI